LISDRGDDPVGDQVGLAFEAVVAAPDHEPGLHRKPEPRSAQTEAT
jgi:hypothetical protein